MESTDWQADTNCYFSTFSLCCHYTFSEGEIKEHLMSSYSLLKNISFDIKHIAFPLRPNILLLFSPDSALLI